MTLTERVLALPVISRRVLALSLLALTGILLWILVTSPLNWVLRSQGEWRTLARKELAAARARANTMPAIRAQLTALSSAPMWQRFYLVTAGTDPAEQIQRDVSALCASAGMRTESIAALPSESQGVLRIYTVRLSAVGTIDQVNAFAAHVRVHPQYLRVERLTITAPPTQGPAENPPLTLTLEIRGYARDERHTSGPAHT